jgi:hypothetical protein
MINSSHLVYDKGGKLHEVPNHYALTDYLYEYFNTIREEKSSCSNYRGKIAVADEQRDESSQCHGEQSNS